MFPCAGGGISPTLLGLGLPIRIGNGITAGLKERATANMLGQSAVSGSNFSALVRFYNNRKIMFLNNNYCVSTLTLKHLANNSYLAQITVQARRPQCNAAYRT